MTIIVSSDKSPISIRSEKRIKIKIQNKSNTLLLNEDFDFTVATVRANVAWDKFETIRVELFEQGNEFAKDPYNTELLKSGPNTLLKLTYHYDQKAQKFKRVN